MSEINNYYGSKIALYFSWLSFYKNQLIFPGVASAYLYYKQIYLNDIDSDLVPYYCLFLCIWGTLFQIFWKRRCNTLTSEWKVRETEEQEMKKELSKRINNNTFDRYMRITITSIVMIIIVAAKLQLMLYYNYMRTNAENIYGSDSLMKYYPTVLYSVVPVIIDVILDPLLILMNNFELHPTEVFNKIIIFINFK